jgi:predicted nuclease of predicted toxin-antitoxin system
VRLCADENVPEACILALRESGHDVIWIREVAPGGSDESVLARAQTENRLLITFDKDFGELVFRRGLSASSGIILFRIQRPSAASLAERIVTVVNSRSDWEGFYSVAEEHTIRMRRMS